MASSSLRRSGVSVPSRIAGNARKLGSGQTTVAYYATQAIPCERGRERGEEHQIGPDELFCRVSATAPAASGRMMVAHLKRVTACTRCEPLELI